MKIVDIQELKSKYPELYNQIFQMGAQAERQKSNILNQAEMHMPEGLKDIKSEEDKQAELIADVVNRIRNIKNQVKNTEKFTRYL